MSSPDLSIGIIANPKKYEVKAVFETALSSTETKKVKLFVSKSICEELLPNDSPILTLTDTDSETIQHARYTFSIRWGWYDFIHRSYLKEQPKTRFRGK